MITFKCLDRSSFFSIRACVFCLVAVCGTCFSASAGSAARGADAQAVTTQKFFCLGGYDPEKCQQHIAELKAVLIQYSKGTPEHWGWVIVRSEDWQSLTRSLHLDRQSPAFTALAERETFLEDALFFLQPKRSDELVRNLQTPFEQLLSTAVRHELGHAICHGGNEVTANRVAEQLRSGRHPNCEGNMSLTRMEELLYLHDRSSSLPGFGRH